MKNHNLYKNIEKMTYNKYISVKFRNFAIFSCGFYQNLDFFGTGPKIEVAQGLRSGNMS